MVHTGVSAGTEFWITRVHVFSTSYHVSIKHHIVVKGLSGWNEFVNDGKEDENDYVKFFPSRCNVMKSSLSADYT